MDLHEAESGALEIRRGRVDPWAGALAAIDAALDVQLAEAVHVAAGSHRRHAAGEIETREALGEICVHAGTGRVIQMLMDHHETRYHRLAGEVEHLCSRRDLHARAGANRADLSVA